MLGAASALYQGGIRILEITFDQGSSRCIEDTVETITSLKTLFGNDMLIGAGTVITTEQVKAASGAGADFILAPNTDREVIELAKSMNLVAIPGAFTPSEIMTAWNAGADIVKLFPAANLGIPYIKAIRGPINHVPLMAVGGVDETNIKAFLDNGYMSCGIGSNIVRNDLIRAGRFKELAELAETFVKAIR
ncbi:MAG: bifunctional 4-hydroxy-2-oxoglutarate aldolase/2-dehydro-3-deoxy-phosphogluconate aldolase, partial [Sphaerochaetaceae bacterium]